MPDQWLGNYESLVKAADPAWLCRLEDAKGTHSMSDFVAHEIAKYVRNLQAAAARIIAPLENIGDSTTWGDGDETDRVYPWYEIQPLKDALLSCSRH